MRRQESGLPRGAGFFPIFIALLFGALLAGCQAPREALQQLADKHGRKLEILSEQPFPLAMLAPSPGSSAKRLRVYLEGDGHSWVSSTQPSTDPSPRNLLVARLASADPSPNVYLARPCQYVMVNACTVHLWAGRRYSQEVVNSLSLALNQIKRRYGNQEFELVGFSGGGALALLLAAQRQDVSYVQTIAGNLSPRLWVQIKKLSPLRGSLEPLDYRKRLQLLPQRHLVGMQDQVVPPSLAQAYLQRMDWPANIQLIQIPDVSHSKGWEKAWPQYRDMPPAAQP